jgi:hypothetical protein
MAGFAINLKLFLSKEAAKFAFKVKRGHQVRLAATDLKYNIILIGDDF